METKEDITSAKSSKSTPHLVQLYGNPPQYALYHPGRVYPHPNIEMGAVSTIPEAEAKIFSEKDFDTMKNCEKNSENKGSIGVGSGDSGNAASRSGNDGASLSAASRREGSTDSASDCNASPATEFSATKKPIYGAAAQNKGCVQDTNAIQVTVLEDPLESKSALNLDSVKGLKVGPTASGISPVTTSDMMGGPQKVRSEKSIQQSLPLVKYNSCFGKDEEEMRRQKRRESNRESAKRSRFRKKLEYEKLQAEAMPLRSDNYMLKNELLKLCEECMEQNTKNEALMEELIQKHGRDVLSGLDA